MRRFISHHAETSLDAIPFIRFGSDTNCFRRRGWWS
jgi:hypothetical protein